jgi:hypothetical protein
MKQQPLQNRRVRPRVDVLLKANFAIQGKVLPEAGCFITNISVSGAGLVIPGVAEGAVSKGQIITLDFSLPGSGRHICAQGELIWASQLKDGCAAGAKFSDQLLFEDIMKCFSDVKKIKKY